MANTRKHNRRRTSSREQNGSAWGRERLRINGRYVSISKTEATVFRNLHDELGRIVPYKRLCVVLGHDWKREAGRHVLRQYIRSIKQTLETAKAPYTIAVALDVGYVLSEIAEETRSMSCVSSPQGTPVTALRSSSALL